MRARFAKVHRLGDVDDRLASDMKGADRQRAHLMAAHRMMDCAAPHSNLEEALRGSRRLCARPAANVDDSKRSTVRPPRHPCPEWSEIRPSGNLGVRVCLAASPAIF